MIIWTLFGTDRKDRLKVVVDGEEMNKLLVVNWLGHRVEGSVAELLHLLLKKISFETRVHFSKSRKELARPPRMLRLPQWRSGWGSPCRCGRCCQHRGPEVAIRDMNTWTGEDLMSAHMHTPTNTCTHASSPGKLPRDLRERQARTSLEGWSWWWLEDLRILN